MLVNVYEMVNQKISNQSNHCGPIVSRLVPTYISLKKISSPIISDNIPMMKRSATGVEISKLKKLPRKRIAITEHIKSAVAVQRVIDRPTSFALFDNRRRSV